MGQRLNQIVCFSAAFLFSTASFAAYKIAIFTDEPSHAKSIGLINYLKSNPPFNKYDVQFEIQSMSTSELNCGPSYGIDRLVTCDTQKVNSKAMSSGADQAFVVSNYPGYGGSGGSVPVITTHPSIPYSAVVHEYLHTVGMGDEYPYSESETSIYCTPQNMSRYLNLAVIEPLSSYGGDYDARNKHGNQIPWYGRILESTPIATNVLGTPTPNQNLIGLFKAKTCQNSPRRIKVWKPGGSINIMESLSAGMNELEPLVDQAMGSKGLRKMDGSTDIKVGEKEEEKCDEVTPTKPTSGGFFDQLANFFKSLFKNLFG